MIPMIRQLGFGSVLLSLAITVPAIAQSQASKPVEMAKRTLAKGKTAKDFQLQAIAGELSGSVQLSRVNAKGPVVIVVLRGFPGSQCPACTAQVGDFVKNAERFAAKNARVLLIYPGPRSQLDRHADDFLDGTTLPQPLTFLLDPGYAFTNAYGLRWDAPNETAYPSTIVLDESGTITYVKISETHRGRSTADEILKTL